MKSTRNSIRRSLIVSAAALMLSVAMLIGTTFAWFTDSVTSGVNKIVAGNLHVEIQDKSGKKIDTLQWVKNDGTVIENQDKILWEPGCTYLLTPFKIVNTGSLALKYKIVITGLDGNDKLLDVIKFTYKTEGGSLFDMDAEGHLAAKGQAGDATDVIAISAHMDEDAGNDYMDETLEGVKFTVLATQDTVENDSFSKMYDENAQYPDVAYVSVSAPTEEEIAAGTNPLATALIGASAEKDTDGNEKQKITADLGTGTFKLTDNEGAVRTAVTGKEVTLNGAGADSTTYEAKKPDASGEGAADYSFDGAKAVVFKNMTIEFAPVKDYQGFIRAGSVRFENCTIKGMGAYWGTGDVVFENCNFVFTDEYNQYTNNLWTYSGSSFTFNNCTFTSKIGKFINVYRQGDPDKVVDITLNNCKFINEATNANEAAVNIKSQCAWNVTINNCTTEGAFPEANGGLWQSQPDYGTANAGNKVTVSP